MLPDLRIVIAAVISTFVLTVGVGFYASSRLINEPKVSTDSIASLDATPVNRIALSWPAPARQSEPLALDFAVTAKALRNPVRDVTSESPVLDQQSERQTPLVRTTATDLAVPPAEKTSTARLPEAAAPTPAPTEIAPAPVVSEAPEPAPEPDIRVAVQYPPILELPPELQAPIVRDAPAVAAAEIPSEAPATTGSIAEPPRSAEAEDDPALSPGKAKQSEPQVVNRPEPANSIGSDDPEIENIPVPKPAPKKAAPKKAAPKKIVRRPARRAARAIPNAVPNFFNLFTLQQPR